MSFKVLSVLLAVGACVNAFAWRAGALRALLITAFGGLGLLLVLAGGFAYWWDSSMRPSHKSATVLVSGLVAACASLLGALRSASADEFR